MAERGVQHVYWVESKSLEAYGGYETFMYKSTEHHQNNENIKYHIVCKDNGNGCMDETNLDVVKKINDYEFEFHNAYCLRLMCHKMVPHKQFIMMLSPWRDIVSISKNHIQHPIVYIVACRMCPFMKFFIIRYVSLVVNYFLIMMGSVK